MSVVAVPEFQPRKITLAKLVLAILLLLGLMSCAAVGQVALKRIKCEPVYLTADDGETILTADDGVTRLTAGRQCYF